MLDPHQLSYPGNDGPDLPSEASSLTPASPGGVRHRVRVRPTTEAGEGLQPARLTASNDDPPASPVPSTAAIPSPSPAATRTPATNAPSDPQRHSSAMSSLYDVTEEMPRGKAAAEREAPGYEVGYGRPPKETRFRKGQSGNPRGRPKGAKNAATIVRELLNARHPIKVNGRSKTLTAREIALQQQTKRAIGGCQKSLQFLLSLEAGHSSSQSASADPSAPGLSAELDETERALLAHELRRVLEADGLNEPQAAAVLGRFGLGFGSEEDRA